MRFLVVENEGNPTLWWVLLIISFGAVITNLVILKWKRDTLSDYRVRRMKLAIWLGTGWGFLFIARLEISGHLW